MIVLPVLRSSAFRLAMLYMTIFGLSVLMLLGFIYWTTAGFLEGQTEETINAELLGLRERYELLGPAGLIHIINERIAKDRSRSSLYLLTDEEFNPLSGNIEFWPDAKASREGWLHFQLHPNERQAMARHLLLKDGFNLLVGRDDADRTKIEQLFYKSLAYGMGLTILLGLVGGVLMSRGMLRRLDVINRASRDVMTGALGRRIPTKGTGDEFDQLIDNLNAMLDRIENLMAGFKQVSDNIAHDLRSPLNRLRGRLELTLLEKPDLRTCRLAIEQAIAATDELLATFNALLKIAQAEAGLKGEDVSDINLATIAADIADFYLPLAEEKGLSLRTDLAQEVILRGNRHLLSQAIANLLDNAIKYTGEGGEIILTLTRQKKTAELVVADTGEGIPEHAREHVIQRFYRLEISRSAPGSGLGLSLVAAVARLHHATLRLEDNRPGLRAVLAFTLE